MTRCISRGRFFRSIFDRKRSTYTPANTVIIQLEFFGLGLGLRLRFGLSGNILKRGQRNLQYLKRGGGVFLKSHIFALMAAALYK